MAILGETFITRPMTCAEASGGTDRVTLTGERCGLRQSRRVGGTPFPPLVWGRGLAAPPFPLMKFVYSGLGCGDSRRRDVSAQYKKPKQLDCHSWEPVLNF